MPTEEAAAQWIAPSKLKPWADNPRVNDEAAVSRVAESIRRFGFGAPIVVRKKTMEIIAGHTRWRAAQKLELARVPVRIVNVSEANARILALADNRLGELTTWAADLGELLKKFDASDVAISGWSDRDLSKLAEHLTGEGSSGEVDLDGMKAGLYTCPDCGCQFDE